MVAGGYLVRVNTDRHSAPFTLIGTAAVVHSRFVDAREAIDQDHRDAPIPAAPRIY